jgi:hypothetical protein
MTRAEHLQWAKDRALAYLPNDTTQAMGSFVSDLRKHEELRDHGAIELLGMHALSGLLTSTNCHDLIEGSN